MRTFTDYIEYLAFFLQQNNLPGKKIQYQMAPPGRSKNYPKNKNFNRAAVSILLYNKNGKTFFPLIQRTNNNLNDKHRGQISLPGGKFDKTDKNIVDCAIRELNEELGIFEKEIKLLGKLTSLYIPVSNFEVYPFVFYSKKTINFMPQPEEVQYILEIDINDLIDNNALKTGKIILDTGIELDDVPYFLLNNHIVWGATAMILNEFKKVIANI